MSNGLASHCMLALQMQGPVFQHSFALKTIDTKWIYDDSDVDDAKSDAEASRKEDKRCVFGSCPSLCVWQRRSIGYM